MSSAEEQALADSSPTVRVGGELVLLGPVQNRMYLSYNIDHIHQLLNEFKK
jgi:hypothetical protein